MKRKKKKKKIESWCSFSESKKKRTWIVMNLDKRTWRTNDREMYKGIRRKCQGMKWKRLVSFISSRVFREPLSFLKFSRAKGSFFFFWLFGSVSLVYSLSLHSVCLFCYICHNCIESKVSKEDPSHPDGYCIPDHFSEFPSSLTAWSIMTKTILAREEKDEETDLNIHSRERQAGKMQGRWEKSGNKKTKSTSNSRYTKDMESRKQNTQQITRFNLKKRERNNTDHIHT